MKIVKLAVSNVKKISAVEIAPTGAMVTIGGKNGAGKSSVLDAIAYALGGTKLVPTLPIRQGHDAALVQVDLGEIVVERRFRRKRLEDDLWGPTTSTLVVKSPEGATFPSPQAILDKLHGRLTFDPLAFSASTEKTQADTLQALVGLDTSALEAQRKTAYDVRTDLNRQIKATQARLDTVAFHPAAPKEETSAVTVTAEIEAARALERKAAAVRRQHADADAACVSHAQAINHAKEAIQKAEERLASCQEALAGSGTLTQNLAIALAAAESAVPDINAITARLADLETQNALVRESQQHAALACDLDELRAQADKRTRTMAQLDADKTRQVAEAQFPVDGLGLSDGEVMFGGVPLKQASTAEQIRVSVAIGIALNPKLKILLIRQGSTLDRRSLADVARQAADADAQVWVERVTEAGDGVSVMIEDGAVVERSERPESVER